MKSKIFKKSKKIYKKYVSKNIKNNEIKNILLFSFSLLLTNSENHFFKSLNKHKKINSVNDLNQRFLFNILNEKELKLFNIIIEKILLYFNMQINNVKLNLIGNTKKIKEYNDKIIYIKKNVIIFDEICSLIRKYSYQNANDLIVQLNKMSEKMYV